jgi:hypothetical protein
MIFIAERQPFRKDEIPVIMSDISFKLNAWDTDVSDTNMTYKLSKTYLTGFAVISECAILLSLMSMGKNVALIAAV